MSLTISDSEPRRQYTGNGVQTAFSANFEFRAASDVVCNVDGVVKTLNTDYTLTGAGISGGGTLTFSVAPANGAIITIYRDMPIARTADQYASYGQIPAEVLEQDLDDITMKMQQLEVLIGRASRVSMTEAVTASDMEWPSKATRAGKYAYWNDTTGKLEPATQLTAGTTLSQSTIGSYLYPRTAAEIAAGVTPTAYYYPAGDVRRYGAVGDGTTDCTTAIQNALLTGHEVYIPEGTWKITASIELDDYQQIRFASRNSIIKGNLTAPLIRGRAGTSDRTYGVQIYSGTLDNTSRSNAGGIGLDFLSMTMAKVFGTQIKNVETAVRNGGASSLGAFYNEFHAVDIITVTTGYSNGTLGNENKVFGGRINDCTTGTSDNDNSCNSYFGIAIEVFTTAHRVSNTSASLSTRFYGSRLENAPSSGTAFSIDASAQDTLVDWPYITGVSSTGLPSAGSAPAGLRTTVRYSELFSESGTTAHKGVKKVTVTRDVASLASGGFRQEGPITVTGAAVGDSVKLTLPSAFPNNLMVGPCIVTNTDTVYFLLHNPSGGAVDPASMDYVFEIADYT